ncbi:hypothetical protein BOTBODRAFT_181318 [Botryobasidium botryosum FD-172 SS1]|uniref:Uncharacterized protein n=1 Tax=Botryobasidium botryosum (strain FD-172 SS1) TaxID=930990 RepID=A0A067LUD0_BOTB1|nr:hypothetical protein BOTBODRAFT_181318 [Botryobasidium botryosum FD-172 SS1]
MANQAKPSSGTLKSLTQALKVKPPARQELRKYSWLPDVLRVEGSIISRIIGPVLTVTAFATAIATANQVYHKDLKLTNNVVPLLSVVVGLILVFRNGTSYDRWAEGNRDWGAMVSNIRNLARLTWVDVTPAPNMSKAQHESFMKLKGRNAFMPNAALEGDGLRSEKIRMLKLMVSFAYAVKHHLRGERGTDYEDYKGVLVEGFDRFDEFGYERLLDSGPGDSYGTNGQSSGNAAAANNSRNLIRGVGTTYPDAQTPLLSNDHSTVEFHPYASNRSLPLPLVIAHELTRVIMKFKKAGCLENIGPAGMNTMNAMVQGMIDQLTAMERVAKSPIPISYSIHLKQCVTLYLFALPFTLVSDLGWRMIPIVTVVAFTLMGIEGIADEIEMPFGTDRSDLPLDKYCQELRDEILYMIERLTEVSDEVDLFVDQ